MRSQSNQGDTMMEATHGGSDGGSSQGGPLSPTD